MPEMHRVESSWVAAIGYDDASQQAHVELIEGGLYAYLGVPAEVWQAFAAAESKGTFVNEVLKPDYRCRPLRGSWPAR
jgi:KTSC domain-containing protein